MDDAKWKKVVDWNWDRMRERAPKLAALTDQQSMEQRTRWARAHRDGGVGARAEALYDIEQLGTPQDVAIQQLERRLNALDPHSYIPRGAGQGWRR